MKTLKTLLAVSFLLSLAYAADQATQDAGKAQSDRERIEKTQEPSARKDHATDAGGRAQDDADASNHGFKKKAKDINRPEPTPEVAPAPKPR